MQTSPSNSYIEWDIVMIKPKSVVVYSTTTLFDKTFTFVFFLFCIRLAELVELDEFN